MEESPTCIGSTSTVARLRPGVFLKSPIETGHKAVAEKVKLAFAIEPPILQRLGSHPRIVRYLGQNDRGLLLSEASHGNLQAYINTNNTSIDLSQRKKWCHQTAEAVAYIHGRGVIHSDLRPENILLHQTTSGSLDLMLCDFGGAVCDELELDGGQLPNDPFYDPTQGVEITPSVDLFGLGSLFYTILTGFWPYRTRVLFGEEGDDSYLDYVDKVNLLFSQGQYPEVAGLVGGEVIMGCWTRKYSTAQQVLDDLRKRMPIDDATRELHEGRLKGE
ncbi:MAG: hypothetical protein M1837_002828 [Sclerophora amabilis]|nr:MAG: hypothetical protein M1837_002828 [Sclerophora amabilis]